MKITRIGGIIKIELEDEDFKTKPWKKIIAKIKRIPGITYDSEDKSWYATDSKIANRILKEIYDKFFYDRNQTQLF